MNVGEGMVLLHEQSRKGPSLARVWGGKSGVGSDDCSENVYVRVRAVGVIRLQSVL